MSAIGSCNASWKDTLLLTSASVGISTSTNTTPAACSLLRAAAITAATCASSPAQNDAGTPMRKPRSGTTLASGEPVMTESSSATSATLRPIGPTVSRVWLMGTTPAPS